MQSVGKIHSQSCLCTPECPCVGARKTHAKGGREMEHEETRDRGCWTESSYIFNVSVLVQSRGILGESSAMQYCSGE